MAKMQEFTAIPIEDITNYLSHYSDISPLPATIDAQYARASMWINSGRTDYISDPIIDWIIAKNITEKEKIPIYDLSYIRDADEDGLLGLACMFDLPYVQKDRIIRILGYLNKLSIYKSDFDVLPLDVIKNIMTHMNYGSIVYLSNILSKFSAVFVDDDFQLVLENKKRNKKNSKDKSKEKSIEKSIDIPYIEPIEWERNQKQINYHNDNICMIKLKNYNYSLQHLRKTCFALGLDIEGTKKELTARIIHNRLDNEL